MSELGDLFSPPFIEDVDGFVTASAITDLVNDLDSVFDSVESAIGNIYGISNGANVEPERFVQSVAASVGTQSEEYVVPSNVEFVGYAQSFALNDNKTFELDLVPSGSILIDDGVHPTSFWTLQLSLKDLSVETDYCIIGTLITFYAPAANFTITYNGIYPSFGKDDYLPNVIPNRKLRITSAITSPVVSNVSGIRYRIVLPTTNSNGYREFADTLEYGFAPHIEAYVDPLGATECPSQYVSVWHKVGSKFKKVKTNAIFIKSNTEYEFTTNEIVTLLDEYAVVLANRGIAEELAATINVLLNHSHNSADGTSTIAHASLNDLIPVSDNEDIKYAGSVLKQSHHPQYMHREGYQNDPGTYNNAMLGDLLLGSINPSSLFNNLLSDSNKIFFSSTSAGHSLYRRVSNGDLHIASSANGLSVSYDDTDISNYALDLAGHKLSNVDSDLMINAISGLTIFQNELEELQNISVNQVLSNTVIANERVHVAESGAIEIGNISITHDGSDIVISGTNNTTNKVIIQTVCDIGTANITNLNIDIINLEGTDKIKFLPAIGLIDTFLAPLTSGGAHFSSAKPLAFTGIGKNTGLSLNNADATEVYANIYTSSENGLIPINSDHNTYFETGTQDVYFLQDTTSNKTVDGTLYAWNDSGTTGTNVTNLKNWPKSSIHAAIVNANRLKFGQYNAISSTGNTQGLNSNKTIIHADNGVLFSRDQSGDYAIASSNKSNIEVANINANNIINNDIQALSATIVSLTIPNNGTLNVNGDTTFNGNVEFIQGIEFANSITVGGNIYVTGTLSGDPTTGNLTTSTGGLLTIAKDAKFNSDVQFQSDTEFTAPVIMSSTLDISGSINAASSINANNITVTSNIETDQLSVTGTATIANLTVNTTINTTADITCNRLTTNNVSNGINTSITSVSSIGALNLNGQFRALNAASPSTFAGNVEIAGDLSFTSSGKTLDTNNGKITNLVMDVSPAANDVVNKEYVDNIIATIATSALFAKIYPIYSLYFSTSNPNSPGNTDGPFGALAFGTWELIEGKVIVGAGTYVDGNGTSRTFNPGEIGGEYSHALSEDELPEFNLKVKTFLSAISNNGDADPHDRVVLEYDNPSGSSEWSTSSIGANQKHNNVQPYFTVYIWRRTA